MFVYHVQNSVHFHRKSELVILALFSFYGVLLGTLVSYAPDSLFSSLMHRTITSPATIVSLVSITFFPFLITAFIMFLSKTYLFFLLAFLKCFSFSFLWSCICISFPNAYWLLQPLLLFSDSVVLVLLHWLWIRHLHSIRDTAIGDMIFCLAVTLAICFIDCKWISPILMIP